MLQKTLLFLSIILLSTQCYAQDSIPDGKRLGLVSYLTYVKAFAEAKMTSLAANEQYKLQPDKAKKFNADYVLLKLATDKLINQLSADLYESNRLKLYNSLNNFLKGSESLPEKYSPYKALIEEIDGRLESFMIRTYSSALGGFGIAEVLGIVELGHTIIADARDAREKKIQSLTALLKELHLKSLAELVKPKEEESKK